MERNQRYTWPPPHFVVCPGTMHIEHKVTQWLTVFLCYRKGKKERRRVANPRGSFLSQLAPLHRTIECPILPSISPWLLRFDWRASQKGLLQIEEWSISHLKLQRATCEASLSAFISHVRLSAKSIWAFFSLTSQHEISHNNRKNGVVHSDTRYRYLWQSS